MTRNDWKPALVFFLFGLVISVSSVRLGLGSLRAPQSGTFPFLLGLLLCIFSAAVLVHSWIITGQTSRLSGPGIWAGLNIKKIVIVLSTVTGFAFVLPYAGYLLSAFVCLMILFRTIQNLSWSRVLILSLLTVVVSYVLFVMLLGVELPTRLVWMLLKWI